MIIYIFSIFIIKEDVSSSGLILDNTNGLPVIEVNCPENNTTACVCVCVACVCGVGVGVGVGGVGGALISVADTFLQRNVFIIFWYIQKLFVDFFALFWCIVFTGWTCQNKISWSISFLFYAWTRQTFTATTLWDMWSWIQHGSWCHSYHNPNYYISSNDIRWTKWV